MLDKNNLFFIVIILLLSSVSYAIIFQFNIVLPETGIIRFLIDSSISLIMELKYLAIFITMILESALIPIPSEVVMPFSGFLCYLGVLSLPLVILTATIANLLGSLISYWLGSRYGRPFLDKYGKYLLISKDHIDYAEKLFNERGEIVILVSRMLPAIRTIISLPAGISRMDLKKFTIYTFIGSLPWNFALASAGFIFGENWYILFNVFRAIELIVIVDGIIILLWIIKKMK